MSELLEEQIDELLSRSIAEVLPTREDFKKLLLEGKKLRIYIGADATGPQLHMGHATNFMLLEKFRRLGHEVIVLFGNFTAMIGDPTDKNAARVRLTVEQVEENINTWKDQVSHILSFDDKENPAIIVRNADWLSKLTFSEIIDISANFTVQRMMERDMFEKRLKEEKPIYVHEFFYPLMQGYDSVHLDVDVEIGGTDQTFNMLAGRTLQKRYHNKDKYVISTTLLVNPVTGKKLMSKSEGGFIALNDSVQDMFGKTMALPDETIVQMFVDCTYVGLDEIKKIEQQLKDGSLNPRDAKMHLAQELVTMYHSKEDAQQAQEYFVNTFSKKEIPTEVAEFMVSGEIKLVELLVQSGNATSMSDARRKIEQGGVSVDGEKIIDANAVINESYNGKVFKIGKLGFVKLKF